MKEMDLDQVRIAMVEITNNRTEGSKLKKSFPDHYAIYQKEIDEIKASGGIVDIPPEIP